MNFSFSTRSRGRTGTSLLTLVFETNASTDSAIRALPFESGQQRYEKNSYLQKKTQKNCIRILFRCIRAGIIAPNRGEFCAR